MTRLCRRPRSAPELTELPAVESRLRLDGGAEAKLGDQALVEAVLERRRPTVQEEGSMVRAGWREADVLFGDRGGEAAATWWRGAREVARRREDLSVAAAVVELAVGCEQAADRWRGGADSVEERERWGQGKGTQRRQLFALVLGAARFPRHEPRCTSKQSALLDALREGERTHLDETS